MNPVLLTRNVYDTATLTSTGFSSTLPVTFTQSQERLKMAQTTATSGVINGTWAAAQSLNMFALRFHNFSATATWRLQLYSDSAWSVSIYDSGTINAFGYSGTPTDISPDYFRLMKNSAMYFSLLTNVQSFTLTLSDASNPDGLMKVSRGFCGKKWEFARGIQLGAFPLRLLSLSTNKRSHDGSIISDSNAQYLAMDLTHKMFDRDADWQALLDAFSYLDSSYDFWFSLFPNRGTWQEMWYQNAWKLGADRTIDVNFITALQSKISLESN